MSELKVSIIIPVYNDSKNLEITLGSIVEQSFSNWEVHIMDGGEDEDTISILQNFINSKIFHHRTKDNGIYDAMNNGMSKSDSEYLYFIGAGDFLADSFVLEEVFTNNSDSSDIIFGNIEYFNLKSKKVNPIHQSSFTSTIRWRNTLHHQGVFYKRTLLGRNPFDESYKILADYNLNLKLQSLSLLSLKKNLIIAKCDGDGVSKKFKWPLYREEMRMKRNRYGISYYLIDLPWILLKFLYKRT